MGWLVQPSGVRKGTAGFEGFIHAGQSGIPLSRTLDTAGPEGQYSSVYSNAVRRGMTLRAYLADRFLGSTGYFEAECILLSGAPQGLAFRY